MFLPLPKGEGWGEGEGNTRLGNGSIQIPRLPRIGQRARSSEAAGEPAKGQGCVLAGWHGRSLSRGRSLETTPLQIRWIRILRQRHLVPTGHMALPPWICDENEPSRPRISNPRSLS